MDIETFRSNNLDDLKRRIREWLALHPVTPDSMKFRYQAVMSPTNQIEYSVVVFYVSLRPI